MLKYIAAALSGIAIAIPYNAPGLYALSWIAFIPLLWSLQHSTWGQAYRRGLLCGLCSYITGSLWIVDFLQLYNGASTLSSLPISALYWLYCAHLPALLCVAYHWLSRHSKLSPVILFPVLLTAFYAGFPTMLNSQLGESQSSFLVAIQATDITGVHGLDFMIGLSNIGVYLLLFSSPRASLFGAAAMLCLWFGYGMITYAYWENKVAQWPTLAVGLVQPNEKPSAELPPAEPGYTRAYPPEMAMTTQLVEQGAELIVWPETRYKGYFRYQHVAQAFAWQAKTLSTPILFQDTERTPIDAQEKMFNTAMIIDQLGQAGGYYRKVHRVPFGEYIPGLNQFESLKQVVYPYLDAFFTDYSAGSGPTALSLNDISLVPLICYEVMFSGYAAQAIGQQTRANKTSSNILVGLSNNGWFGESLQPYQHTNASQLRSVENRVSLIHVTNNGPSIVVSPSGRRLYQTQYHQRQAMLTKVPYASTAGSSFYSRFPGWFIRCIYVFVFALSIYTLAQYFFIQTRAANR